jgi:hypothetical protein
MSEIDSDSYYIRFVYAGLLPFISVATLIWIIPQSSSSYLVEFFISYSSIILSFMAGSLFLFHALPSKFRELFAGSEVLRTDLSKSQRFVAALMVLSLIACLALLTNGALAVALLGLGFLAYGRLESSSLPLAFKAYIEFRSTIQRAVLVSHLMVFVFLLQL